MNLEETKERDCSAEGTSFADRQILLAQPSNLKQFRAYILSLVGSAYALAEYAEEQMHAHHLRWNEEQNVSRHIHERSSANQPEKLSPGIQRLYDGTRLLRATAMEMQSALRGFAKLPFARSVTGAEMPRIFGVAHCMLNTASYRWSVPALSGFVAGYQVKESLMLREIWALPIALKQALLEEILAQASGAFGNLPASDAALDAALLCLQQVGLPIWSEVLEPLIPFESTLRQDPAGAHGAMDFDSRNMYRTVIEKIAAQSPLSEIEVAENTVALARASSRQPNANPRIAARKAHVGYYLIDAGRKELETRCGFQPRLSDRVRSVLRAYPDDFYIGGIQTLALLAMAAIIIPLVPLYNPFGSLAIAFLFLLLPVSQGAVELMNHAINAILSPRPLPKLDFSRGIPEDCKTLVAVPTLLLNKRQVRDLVEELEVRSLANQDTNVHYALLTDLPDSVEKPLDGDTDPLVLLAGRLIEELNRRYAGTGGSFLMLHRHRVFNPRQGVWMGWERKRGKLLDLNRLIMGGMDCFPYKTGDTSVLNKTRYVLTLDSDTKLPRDSVHRMIGAIAHPLNRAVLDPQRRIVTHGYGLMQPRVGVTVKSAARSRLAAIYSGQTGFDIYTRAVSDVYQDLYGTGSFTGKGLYEIQVLHEVLDRRFPENSLLSHDLIEGAYCRVGLLSDVEVLDDYPSHYSAQNRRKHRWVRGDWQILRWLLDTVPDAEGQPSRNPTSIVSRWKIFDNLRRSLVEPATFLLLVMGWLWLPGTPRYWTIATLLIVFVPVAVQFLFSLVRASFAEHSGYIRQAVRDSWGLLFSTALNFAFLAHQTQLMADAIFRSLVRSFVTGQRLLEWETAAESEVGGNKTTPVETTMSFVPLLSAAIVILLWIIRPGALPWALPILALWAMAKPITTWLNRPSRNPEAVLSAADTRFLRKIAWRTWLYFSHFSNENNHGLVPDNVQKNIEGEGYTEALRFSPTNAGLQLNARQAAIVLGYLTLPEYVEQTLENLRVLDGVPKWKGHLLNWYSTATLERIGPYVASTVDSGNFLASLCSLRMGTLELPQTPWLPPLKEGLMDIVCDVQTPVALAAQIKPALQVTGKKRPGTWLASLLDLEISDASGETPPAVARLRAIATLVRMYLPWLQPKFATIAELAHLEPDRPLDSYTPENSLTVCQHLRIALSKLILHDPEKNTPLANELVHELHSAEKCLAALLAGLKEIGEICERMFQAPDFSALLHPARRLLTVGYDTEKDCRLDSCYDLLASEARIAMFLAIAKGDVRQDLWFKAGRKTTQIDGNPVLMSWSGTMFEYMMPTLWMQTSPDTLLAQSLPAAVLAQRQYVTRRRMPWGVSEAGYTHRDSEGNYQYHAFGVPSLAVNPPPEGAVVIAPYASVLALEADPAQALANLRRIDKLGWMGKFGFYESADYSADRQPKDESRFVLVRSWMAHHQGMSLLAITNVLAARPFQRWFHKDPRVRATELLLQEKPVQIAQLNPFQEVEHTPFKPAPQ